MPSIETIINRQLLKWELQRKTAEEQAKAQGAGLTVSPIVTVSRQIGSRGSYFASRLATEMGYQRIHREVIDAISQSAGYRKRIIQWLDEKHRSDLELAVESFLSDRSIDHRDYFRHLFKVVLSMSELGGVVLLGRGGNFILGPKRGFHIRFVAPHKTRVENLMKYRELTHKDAEALIKKSDVLRRQLIRKLFRADIDDPVHYDLVINSAYVDIEDLLGVVKAAVTAKFTKLAHLQHQGTK